MKKALAELKINPLWKACIHENLIDKVGIFIIEL